MTVQDAETDMRPTRLRCERLHEAPLIHAADPLLSWGLIAEGRNRSQSACQVHVDRMDRSGDPVEVWDSGKLTSVAQEVAYAGEKLETRERYRWKVRVWDEAERVGPWSVTSTWEMGLSHGRWDALWIEGAPPRKASPPTGRSYDAQLSAVNGPVLLRRSFSLERDVVRAIVYVTACGLYRLHLNGTRVSDRELAPGWTDYAQRIQYHAYDITDELREGENVFGAVIADGWYCGYFGYDPQEGR